MKPRHVLALLLPLGLSACAVTTADLVGEHHPANPAAPAAPAKAMPSTLETTGAFAPPPASMPTSMPSEEDHDHSEHSGGTAGETSMDDIVYTCPMHPDVVQDSPGTCPECGMTLKPATQDTSGMGGQHDRH